ncbi:selenium-binding protein SBP56-related protein [Streptomyces aureus]
MDDQWLYVSAWGTGDLHQYDVSDPFHPRQTAVVRLGGIVSRQPHPAEPDTPLTGGAQMVELSRDGRRVYLTNSLYSTWDAQLYPAGIDPWMVKLDADTSHGGLCADSRFYPHGPDFWACTCTRRACKAATPPRFVLLPQLTAGAPREPAEGHGGPTRLGGRCVRSVPRIWRHMSVQRRVASEHIRRSRFAPALRTSARHPRREGTCPSCSTQQARTRSTQPGGSCPPPKRWWPWR